jgi:DNA-binding NtrC family response regulator
MTRRLFRSKAVYVKASPTSGGSASVRRLSFRARDPLSERPSEGPVRRRELRRLRRGGAPPDVAPLADVIERAERAAIAGALRANGGNLSATAQELRIDRNTLKRKMSRYGL